MFSFQLKIFQNFFLIPYLSNSLGLIGENGALTGLGATALSLYAYLPACKICITIFLPSL